MAAPTDTFVDPAIAANTGTGTIADPFGDLQFALDQVTRDTTNGDQFNVKAGTDEILSSALSLTTYGTPAVGAELIFRGYASAARDGGIGGITGNGSVQIFAGAGFVHWIDMHLHSSGVNDVIVLSTRGSMINCEVDDSTGDGVLINGDEVHVVGCDIHNLADDGINCGGRNDLLILHNYFTNGTNDFDQAIRDPDIGSTIRGNIISVDGASYGIRVLSGVVSSIEIDGNSILSSSGTGKGIAILANTKRATKITNNLVEGFSGAGGEGIEIPSGDRDIILYANNAVFNNTTNYDVDEDNMIFNAGDNEVLGATPFDKSGADTFANRFAFFSPVNVGNVHGGAYVG